MSTSPESRSGPPAEVPSCYRHPGRETYVRCTRCDRFICPDCMRDAAVGHQCVECVREGSRTVRQGRTVVGGRPTATPVVTYTLIAINIVAFLAELADNTLVTDYSMLGRGVNVYGQVIPGMGVAHGEWYRLITGGFLHSLPSGGLGITHILFNMWALWVLGVQLEPLLGRARFLTLYMLSLLGGNVLVYVLAPDSLTLGASGAIYGLFGAYFVIGRRMRADVRGIVFLLAINLAITFSVPGISWQGHVGGLITGGAVAAAYAYAPQDRRNLVAVSTAVLALAIVVLAVVAKTAQLA